MPTVSVPFASPGTAAVNCVADEVSTISRRPFSVVRVTRPDPMTGEPTEKSLATVTVTTPLVMLTAVDAAEVAVGLHVNPISRLFHHQSSGGARIVWRTMLALVNAGSREFPMTRFRSKENRFVQLIVSPMVLVVSAIKILLSAVLIPDHINLGGVTNFLLCFARMMKTLVCSILVADGSLRMPR